MKLAGKSIVVTGGSGGIGQKLVKSMQAAGGRVLVVGRHAAEDGDFMRGDFSSMAGIHEAATLVAAHEPDILVNLAGVQYFGALEGQTPEHIALMYHVNLIAPTLLARAVIPGMRARGAGHIVNIGSVFGSIPFAHFVTYSSTKAGLKALSQSLRRELAGSCIEVTHVSPRAVKTEMNDARVMEWGRRTAMNMDAPEHVASCIVRAIEAGKKEVVIGAAETVFTRINALLPGMVDKALAKGDQIAREILSH